MRYFLSTLIGIAMLVMLVTTTGCTTSWVGADQDGNKIVLTEEQHKALPAAEKANYAKVSGFDDAIVTQKIDPATGVATNILEVTSGFLPPPFNMVGMGLLSLLSLWGKVKNVKVARGSALAAQAIEAVKALEGSDVWTKTMKPILTDGEIKSTGLLKATMPDKL